ncbi:MAG: amidohydrolase family protein [Pseudomonadota bacterium]
MKTSPITIISRPPLSNSDGSPAPPPNHPVVHRAGWVVASPRHIYRQGYVQIERGKINAIGTGSTPNGATLIDHGPGAITPALVNAHTHLELGALCEKLSFDKGFQHWVSDLLHQRAILSKEEMETGILRGKKELMETGCAVVGDISTLGASRELLSKSGLYGVWFQEFIGNIIPHALSCGETSGAIRNAYAGHAPHTSAPALLMALKAITREKGLPFSIHVSESTEEMEFIGSAAGKWANFLAGRGIDFSDWGLPAASPVFHLDRLGILDEKTLAVHLLHAERKEFELLAKRNVTACICPRSNENLHGKLPDLPGMMAAGLNVCLGTDSLASVSSLNLWEEMRLVATRYPTVSPADIWAMATANGAAALGFSELFGTLEPGRMPAMLYVPVTASSPAAVLERMVFGEMDTVFFDRNE